MLQRSPRTFPRAAMWLGIVGSLVALVAPRSLAPAWGASLRRSAVVRAVEQAKPSVVNIHGRKTAAAENREQSPAGDVGRQINGMGTGIVIDERGYVLTNFHVVDGVGQIKVTLADERTLPARVVANDPKTDLAVLKVETEQPLPVIQVGTSSDLMPGEEVIAVGNAFGYTNTVTRGIISALHRSVQVTEQQQYPDLIQTDASINPGNSGGPLLNIDGETIGINVAVRVGAQGIGFALPIDDAMEIAARMMSRERSVSAGAAGETRMEARQAHFVITQVVSGGPAENAGLRAGDTVVSVDDRTIERTLDWERALVGKRSGDSLAITVLRDQEEMSLTAVLTGVNRAGSGVDDLAWKILGLRLSQVPTSALAGLADSRYRGGLRVTAVRPDGPAAQRGVRRGDILVGMHRWETVSLDNVAYILNNAELRETPTVKFYVLRGDETLYGHLRVSLGD